MEKEKIMCPNCEGLRISEEEEKAYSGPEKLCICPRNAQGGREYRIKAPVGKVFDPSKIDMNDVVKIAMENDFKREPIQLQSNMGMMNVFAWQKDVMDPAFWVAICKGIQSSITPTTLGKNFFELCMTAGWSHAVEYLSEIIKESKHG